MWFWTFTHSLKLLNLSISCYNTGGAKWLRLQHGSSPNHELIHVPLTSKEIFTIKWSKISHHSFASCLSILYTFMLWIWSLFLSGSPFSTCPVTPIQLYSLPLAIAISLAFIIYLFDSQTCHSNGQSSLQTCEWVQHKTFVMTSSSSTSKRKKFHHPPAGCFYEVSFMATSEIWGITYLIWCLKSVIRKIMKKKE